MILVTGGLGFIGSNFVISCLQGKLPGVENLDVCVLDSQTYAADLTNLSDVIDDSKLRIVQGDVRDVALVNSLVSESKFVVHFAAESHVDRSIDEPSIFISTNVTGTFNLLNASNNYERRIVVVSTDEVYGSLDDGEADEFYNLNPSSPYSASKASGDLIANSFFKTFNTDVIVTRSANNYGLHQNPEKLIPKLILNLLAGEKLPIYGDGMNVRNWIHVQDHCLAISKALTLGIAGETYNIGSSEYLTNLDVCRFLCLEMGKSEDEILFVPDRKGHDFRYALDSSKARRELAWKTNTTFRDSIPEMIRWYSQKYSNQL